MKNLIMNLITDSVRETLGNEYHVTTQDVRKNNGHVLRGLIIKKGNKNICPTIYLNDFVDDYLNKVPIEKIVNKIIQIYKENKDSDYDISFFHDFHKVKYKIVYELINTEKNEEYLRNIPSVKYLDLSIIFRVIIDISDKKSIASITITNSHLNLWNVSKEDIYSFAIKNTPKIMPANIKSMNSILQELILESSDSSDDYISECPMYILTNECKFKGCCCILYPNVLSEFANSKGSDFYILPSSIHEVILLPNKDSLEPSELRDMVCSINETVVSNDEILSNNVYYYSMATGEVSQI